MTTAGARPLRDEDDQRREAVLLEWERKIEAAERRSGRFDRPAPVAAEPEAPASGARFERPAAQAEPEHPGRAAGRAALLAPAPQVERRTITITGQTVPARRRSAVAERQLAQPDRVALWAFLLGLFLVAVAAGTAHA
jgi:hypothetical protein